MSTDSILLRVVQSLPLAIMRDMQSFMQRQVNRLQTGQARYGPPIATKRYLTRLSAEVDAYVLTGNAEHLINAANYCLLESIAPEHKKFHFDNTVESVMRRAPKKEHRVWK